jgi:hypothetical protein
MLDLYSIRTGAPKRKGCHAVKTIRVEKAEGQFLELLARLSVDSPFTDDFVYKLEQQWHRSGENVEEVLKNKKAELDKLVEDQASLRWKYVRDDPRVLPFYDSMNSEFETKMAMLNSTIGDMENERASFAELLAFSQSLLVDLGSAWKAGNIDQKQRVQNTLFPDGLFYHPNDGIFNPDNDCLFNQLQDFLSGKVLLASPTGFEPVLSP